MKNNDFVEDVTVADLPATLSAPQASVLLSVPLMTIYRFCNNGDITANKVGKKWFIPTQVFIKQTGISPSKIKQVL